MTPQIGGPRAVLTERQVRSFVAGRLATEDLDGRSVCVVVPDGTRSCPLPLLLSAVRDALHDRVSRLTVLIALGTHAPMSRTELIPGLHAVNHEWWEPSTFASVGAIGAGRVAELSGGLLRQEVDVRLNRAVVEHDVALVVGPVFPHEVVGFSGGNKYFFPGVAGADIIDLSHWLGALITSSEIIGTRGITPVRALIDEASSLIPTRRLAFCVVVRSGSDELHSMAYGTPEAAWAAAAEVSSQAHVRYLDRPVKRVVSLIPAKYDDMWTAAKGFYKLEPVVADGGEVILYAPHVTTISAMHPEIEEIGYHCRDYFTKQWDRFKHLHWGVLAHSTHLRGAGTWDAGHGERCRVEVTLATAIPEQVVRRAGLGYLDPAGVDLDALAADPETLVVPQAGEVLYRLRA
ncbi:nickel-dependent lactate racemase [Streptosporangium becharense]|uniref:Nickel-dependent lactate racemase n=1 Tax=Streptosporangium becharense TaxID=1816182 RepID=A0A7W9IAL2_9ACTN|nr:lactate racemase domain-containing protein [Streptosporangium becharense]MBB2914175.1 nickel-dependent lactate racemase [Streptosporangium becharense]MBB5817202.1 nickel-dependent lactate racemase [Streptosporangium becharense]